MVPIKDKNGQVIGFVKLNFAMPFTERLHVAFEAVGT